MIWSEVLFESKSLYTRDKKLRRERTLNDGKKK